MRITLLGTGSSGGVPIIGCDCAVCTSDNPKNTRSRASILVQQGETTLLIDTSPDLRQQALREKITSIDAILYTHAHADHTHGIDDIRAFNYRQQKTLPAYATEETFALIEQSFGYVFAPPISTRGWFRPSLNFHPIEPSKAFTIGGITIEPFLQHHGRQTSLGFRFGDMAYSTDVNHMPEEAFTTLEGISTWVVDCLRYEVSPTHAHLDMTLEWIERVKPERAILTHMNHELCYDTLSHSLPDGIEPGYDGMVIEG